ncbi:hypothetical protein HA466_0300910 [Hirschfeldia incana]|nr:hypothetical protein HA466_0300910 [Hirschfeldia incana]
MASLVLTFSLLFATFSSPFVDAFNYSYGSTLTAPALNTIDAFNYSDGNSTLAAPALNPIDACWRRDPKWSTNRQALAKCAVGFGKHALGGSKGPIYVVTSPADEVGKPKPGTLRFGATQPKPLWITFQRDMVIRLKTELEVTSHKTIDGRGAKVDIGNGPCVSIKRATNVIIHGITVHNCRLSKGFDGDGIRVFKSKNVWIDHCHLSRCQDGLLDVVTSSTAVTISNNRLINHQKAMLLGHSDKHVADKNMKVTVAFNVFGPGLTERMPRVRFGYAHVANNMYNKWNLYAIGGSADPTIFSEANHFVAPDRKEHKEITKRMDKSPAAKKWKWSTNKDVFINGAFFTPSGGPGVPPPYAAGEAFPVAPGAQVPALTASAGPLPCVPGRVC